MNAADCRRRFVFGAFVCYDRFQNAVWNPCLVSQGSRYRKQPSTSTSTYVHCAVLLTIKLATLQFGQKQGMNKIDRCCELVRRRSAIL